MSDSSVHWTRSTQRELVVSCLLSILVRCRVYTIQSFSIRQLPVLYHRSFAILSSQTQPNICSFNWYRVQRCTPYILIVPITVLHSRTSFFQIFWDFRCFLDQNNSCLLLKWEFLFQHLQLSKYWPLCHNISMFAICQTSIHKFLGKKSWAVHIFYSSYESTDKDVVFRWLTSSLFIWCHCESVKSFVRAAVDLAIVSVACITFKILPYIKD
jgi:hypothetical protein